MQFLQYSLDSVVFLVRLELGIPPVYLNNDASFEAFIDRYLSLRLFSAEREQKVL